MKSCIGTVDWAVCSFDVLGGDAVAASATYLFDEGAFYDGLSAL